jgi:uncharacterized DUF497 family protein
MELSFLEAVTVFRDPLGILKQDNDHSIEEDRFPLIGVSLEQRITTVVHVERGGRFRIISARRAAPRERRDYERRDGKGSVGG